jgi:hypothetical protein
MHLRSTFTGQVLIVITGIKHKKECVFLVTGKGGGMNFVSFLSFTGKCNNYHFYPKLYKKFMNYIGIISIGSALLPRHYMYLLTEIQRN